MHIDSQSHAQGCIFGMRAHCTVCPASQNCLFGAEATHVAPLAADKVLVDAGASAQAIYVVRAGCLKSFTMDEQGNERVRGFFFPGDIIGLDALGNYVHPATVVAVTTAQVCRVAMAQIGRLAAEKPDVLRRLLQRTSQGLAQALAHAGDFTADQRVAAFLLEMRERVGGQVGSVHLPMTRRDIANYLRLAAETVCRVLTRFEASGSIRSANKSLQVVDAKALRTQAGPATPVAAVA